MSFLSVNAYAPLVASGGLIYNERLEPQTEQYTISLERGFDTGTFSITGSLDYLIDWFKNGLVRHVVVRGPDGFRVWEGYVSRMSLTLGGISRTKAIDGVGNRVIYKYTPLNTGANPPTTSAETSTTVNDTASQAIYGIKAIVVNGGQVPSATASVAAATALAQLAYPQRGEIQTVGGGAAPQMQIELRGYAYMLDWFNYTQTGTSGTDDADDVIQAVLAADPNGVISTSAVGIDANTTATEQYWDGTDLGWTVIKKITDRGQDVSGVGVPWVAMILDDRRLTFKAAERLSADGSLLSSNKNPRLYRSITDEGEQFFTDEGGRELPYWQIRPDHILYTQGIPGEPTYIRRVSYTPPNGLQVEGEDDAQSVYAALAL